MDSPVTATTSRSLDLARDLSWAVAARQQQDFFRARSLTGLILQGSRSCRDPAVLARLKSIFESDLLDQGLHRAHSLIDFVQAFQVWIMAHKHNRIQGLESFVCDFAAGTTQSFDSFYHRHRDRRMRCLVGEYFYHIKTWIATARDWSFVTDQDPLMPGDAMVISVPFCDTGNQPENLANLLDICDSLGVPVLVDCCYWPISHGINLDLEHACIDTVAFSISKAFPVANLRIGMRYRRPDTQDGQSLLHNINYNNTLSAEIGLRLINDFAANYIVDIYQTRQQAVCHALDIQPSQSVLFGIGSSDWNTYSRAHLLRVYGLDFDPQLFVNRISLVSVFDNWDIFSELYHES